MQIKEADAIILRSYKLAEADKIVVFLTDSSGLIRGVAKGARRLKSRYGASLEPFTLIHLTYLEKENKELVNIRSAEIIRSYFELAKVSEIVAALEYIGELVIEFAPPHLADEKFFRLLKAIIAAINAEPEQIQAYIHYFELWALRLSGFLPDFIACNRCGTEFSKTADEKISMMLDGVLICVSCAGQSERVIPQKVYLLLRAAKTEAPKHWASQYAKARPAAQRDVVNYIHSFIERHLERRPQGLSIFASGLSA
jgi:DNA repair protein RecO (recombination protein O)